MPETTGNVFLDISIIINDGNPQNLLTYEVLLLLNHYSNFLLKFQTKKTSKKFFWFLIFKSNFKVPHSKDQNHCEKVESLWQCSNWKNIRCSYDTLDVMSAVCTLNLVCVSTGKSLPSPQSDLAQPARFPSL